MFGSVGKFGILASLALLASPAFSTVTTYTDRAAFEGATIVSVSDGFDDVTADVQFDRVPDATILRQGYAMVSDHALRSPDGGPQNLIDVPAFHSYRPVVNGTAQLNLFLSEEQNTYHDFIFDSGVSAFGFDFRSGARPREFYVELNGEKFLIHHAPGGGFFGLTSSPFTQIRISTGLGTDRISISLDNLLLGHEFGTLSAPIVPSSSQVPAPAAIGLLGVGFACLSLRNWRRKKG